MINCRFGDHIRKELFCDWNKPWTHDTIFYGIYGCNADAEHLPPYVKILDKADADLILRKISLKAE